jgi:hypothetical protein
VNGGWRHERIVLRTDSDRAGFKPIEFSVEEGEQGIAVAEM